VRCVRQYCGATKKRDEIAPFHSATSRTLVKDY
jgi:hypothetical protein